MSASVDDQDQERARRALTGWLDQLSEGRCSPDEMREGYVGVCREDAEASWEALALLDQYQRRRRLDPALAQTLKADIEQIVFRRKQALQHLVPREAPRPAEKAPIPPDSTSDLEPAPESAPPEPPAERAPTQVRPLRKLPPSGETSPTAPSARTSDHTRWRADVAQSAPTDTRQRDVAPPDLSARAPRAEPRPAGREVLRDRYELLSVITRDRSGVVFCALDRRRTHLSEAARYVAVKVLNAQYAEDPAALVELERQFHQAQTLSHPNIAGVFDLDRDGDRYFVVMELLKGARLSDLLQQLDGAPMRRSHAMGVISGVGAALVYAHGRDIVHGDLNPANITITEEGEVRVSDFGFARARSYELHRDAGVDDGSTTAYATPERINGSEPEESDDVYSLACIAYELLSGRHPFAGRSVILARAHNRRPPRIPGLDRSQMRALQRALLCTRGERRISAAGLLAALGANVAGATAASPDEMLEPQPRTLPWGRIALIAAAAVIAFALSYLAPQFFERQQDAVEPAVSTAPPSPQPITSAAAPAPSLAESGPVAPEAAEQPAESDPDALQAAEQPATAESESVERAAAAPSAAAREEGRSAPAPAPTEKAQQSAPSSAGRPAIAFDRESYVVRESDGLARLQVIRTGSTRESISFRWLLRPNSAEGGDDYAAIGPGEERIAAGQRKATIAIPLVSDAVVENTEVFLVEIQAIGENVALGERAHAAVIIVDDD